MPNISSDSSDNEVKNNSWEEESSESSDEHELEIEDSDNNKRKKTEERVSSSSSGSSSSGDETNKEFQEKKFNEEKQEVRRSDRPKQLDAKKLNDVGSSVESESSNDGSRKKKSVNWIPTLSDSESEESDDDDSDSSYDVPQRKKKRAPDRKPVQRTKPQQRRKQLESDSDSDSDYGKRRSKKKGLSSKKQVSRGTTSNVRSYKEDSEGVTDSDDIIEPDETTAPVEPQEEFETIEKVLRHRQGLPGDTGANTTIYAVREEKPSAADNEANTETELQFCIKWKGWSNMHNTWESQASLTREKCAGMKKLENYVKRMDEIDAWKQRALPEDVDYFECQQEMNEDIQKHNQQVERIIAHKESTDSPSHHPDYLCKWVGLPYSDTTWEDGNLTARFFQSHIDEYLEREQADTIPNKNAKVLRQRPKFNAFKTQPDFLGSETLQLRDYQVDGINWLVHAWTREVSCILSDEMGLGKTIQTISFLSYLFHRYRLYGPYLVVVPLSTMDAWAREFKLWAPALNIIVYIGDVNSRQKIQEFEWCNAKTRKLKFNVLLTTYEMLLRDKDLLGSIYWATLMVDEAHRLKNDDSLFYRVLIDFRTNYRLLITGTPLQNSLKELWSLMHFIMPKQFDSWEDFESKYSIQDKDGLQKLHRDLEPYLLRRVKKDVEKSLPAKVEQILRVEMSQMQKQYYKLILTRNVTELCKELKGKFNGLLNIIVELKKCCNHAFLIKPLEPAENDPNVLEAVIKGSGKMILLDKLMCRLKATGHRVLIFSQMVRMLDVIADYLYLKRFQFQRLDGSVRGDQRKRALDHFNAEGSQDFCFLLSTRAGGLGINLATADTVIIFDSDWNPQNDLQAMARAHRIGQKNKVNIYRFVTKSTIEEDIIERAKKKMVLDHLIIQRMDTTGRRILSKTNTASSSSVPFNKEELSNILKFGAGELFKDHDTEADQKLQAMDIDEILERAETQDTREHDNGVGEELLSQFKVVNYAAFDEEAIEKPAAAPTPMQKLWEEIIPEKDRKKMEEELEAEKKQQQVLKPRSRKTVQKMNVGVPDEKSTKKSSSRTVSKANDAQSNRKIKSKAFVDTDTSSDESDSTTTVAPPEDEKPKKNAAAKKKSVVQQENVKGFTDAEIRRFVKSFKKFARPMSRLDTIAEDAELTDKSSAELREFGELLKKNCEEAVKDYQEKLQQDETFDGRKNGATLKLSGVTINAPSILKSEIDLEPLFLCLPSQPTQQKTYRLTVPTRSVHWGKTWGVVEDSMLLVGMLKYGVGSWDAIKNDPALTLSNKILPVGDGKPQVKHLLSRAEYLLKLLKQQTNNNEKTKKNKKKSSKPNASATVADEKPAEKKEKKKKADNKSPTIEVHSTIEANVVVEEISDMNDEIFKKCKERMRPERKCLQLLHTPDNSLTPEEQVQTTKKCLLKIGDHVERCCQATPEQQDLRSKLWSFVAKFTELGSSKLYKLYRTACKKRDHEKNVTAHHEKHVTHENKSLSPNRQQLDRRKASGLQKSSSRSMKIPHKDKISHHASSSKAWERKDEKRQTTATSRDVENNDSSNHAATQMTYREWKEKQKEKELNRPLKQDKLHKQYPSGFDPRSRPRYHRDIPDAVKSPSSSRSPLSYSGDNRQYRGDSRPYSGDNRKRHRTSSNNSAESSGSMAKKYHPNPREERS